MIEAIELTSTRRSRGAGGGPVQGVSFDVYPGQVTALLGAPGTGKSTVLRLMVELEPGGGRTLFGGRPYRALRPAVREVGLALNPDAVHPGRTVQAHLQLYAAGGGVPKPRIAEVLEVAGLSTQATVRCGRLDPGQRQRLAIAAALLGDPAALILDEPHALDTHGMSWFHALIRAYAAQGRTVLVAATDPDTLSGTADHVVVLRRDDQDGISRVIASRSAAEVFDERRATVVQVRSPQAARLAAALEAEGARLAPAGPGALQVRGLDRARIGEVAHVAGVCLHELCEIGHDDDVFGLRPVPRQKELLPGLNRADTIWHSGVRLVADEIEEAEVIEAAAEASAEAAAAVHVASEQQEPAPAHMVAQETSAGRAAAAGSVARLQEAAASASAQVPAERRAGGPTSFAGPQETTASTGARVPVERQAGAQGLVAGPHEAVAGVGAQVPAERQAAGQRMVAGSRESLAGVLSAAEQQAGAVTGMRPAPERDSVPSAGAQAQAEQPAGRVAAGQVGGAADAQPSSVSAREGAASASVQAQAEQQAVRVAAEPVGGAADVRPAPEPVVVREAAGADSAVVRSDGATPSVAGSWRTQGSVAGSRWSAVKGSQVRPSAAPTVAGGKDSASNLASAATDTVPADSAVHQSTAEVPQSVPATAESTEPRTPAKSPEAPRPTHRRAGAFGLRWGRSRSQRPVTPSPEPVGAVVGSASSRTATATATATTATAAAAPAPAPVQAQPQPAVPFTVASPAPQPDSGSDGMTPWRAAAARAAQQSQQQHVPVAEAAPAEQETSA
ncbi:ABC-type multidrug transport system ATPase subunit [Catenulispora sp. EB89]|uniref:ATP-binding cassette domain-containing protein n=1 Tax=Catenulispora sp. EB89 TaxID=3156257 RepID=UPI00351933A0